jgi:4-hydroxy-tetrahydrodipicolinate synthase/2-dehydro-3-deoxy-phosphogluconate/2-dehydro-3-deoxy-6-phosphogalactonate aldolase
MSETRPHGDPLGIHGVVPPTITAFDEDGDLAAEECAAHARYVVDGGCHGVFPLGTNGEEPLVTAEEHGRVVEAVVDEVGGEVPVIAGIGAPATRQAVANARRVERAGADGIVAVTPYYYPVDDEAAVAHYEAVTGAVDVPVYVYHIPSRTGNHLSLAAWEKIAGLDGIAGLKDSSKDVPWFAQAMARAPDVTYLVGSDSLLDAGFGLGAAGAISAVANVFPSLVVDCYDASAAGHWDAVRDLQHRVFRIRDALKSGPYMAGVKTALEVLDVPVEPGPLREPLRRMDGPDRAALADRLDDLGVH